MNDEIKLINKLQVCKYIKHEVQPKRVEVGESDRLVFIFSKEETNDLYTKWLNREL